jgi:hypothetical protein
MRERALVLLGLAAFFVLSFAAGNRLMTVRGQTKPGEGFAAVPGAKGGEDITGPYDPVADGPKPLSQLSKLVGSPLYSAWKYRATLSSLPF